MTGVFIKVYNIFMEREQILTELNALADKKWAEDIVHKNIINTKTAILGVRTPDMRKMASKYAKCGIEDIILALNNEYFEEIELHGFLLGYIKDINRTFDMLIEFLPQIDNWAVCDQTVASVKVFKKDKDNKYLDKFIALTKSNKEFYARVGLIMLMSYYLKDETIDKVLSILPQINNHSYYVDMAVAWLVSVAFVKYREKTYNLIKSQKLVKFVQNKAISKCHDSYRVSTEDKEMLKKYRIK